MTSYRWLPHGLALALACVACGAPPGPASTSTSPTRAPSTQRRAALPDDCAPERGKPPPEPLLRDYQGVARKARCQREVYTIMGGVTHFLGVKCDHCHLEPNYAAPTHRKQIANWMATQLIPRLAERDGGGEVWCNDCHAGKAKILGNPRQPQFAIDWMTTHLVEDFDSSLGQPLRCRTCHKGDLGSPEFQRKIILSDSLPEGRPLPEKDPTRLLPSGLPPGAAAAPGESAPAAVPLPEYGGR